MATAKTPNVTIELDEYEKFKTLAERSNQSISNVIRQFITIYIEEGPKILEKGTTKKTDTKKNLPFEKYMFSGDGTVDSTNYKQALYGS